MATIIRKPLISVIVPTLNEAKYLEPTLKSIVNQNTNIPYELIVSDGNSTDGSTDVAKKYADRVLVCKERGVGIGRHFGAINANKNSKYFVFTDADTQLPGYYLAYVYETFEANPDIVAFSTGFVFSEQSSRIKLAETLTNKYLNMRNKMHSATLPGFSTCVRRDAYFKCGGYRNVPLDDIDLSRRVKTVGITKFYPDVKVINSSRRLEVMGLLGTLYYFSIQDLGRQLSSSRIGNLARKLNIGGSPEYVGVRKSE